MRQSRRAALALSMVVAVLTAGCSSPEPCQPAAPAALPGGADPGPGATSLDGDVPVAIWRSVDAFVVQRILDTDRADEPECPPGEIAGPGGCFPVDDLQVRGSPAVLVAVGDQAETEWILSWASGGCRYETIFGPLSHEEAQAYAAGY
jgi:hypothetical protein